MNIINIYTDGACSGNQHDNNLGGWGAVLEFGKHQKEIFGGEVNTTNNRMEMKALIEALKSITKENQTIRVFSDSSYLMDCFRKKWYENWLKNNWKTSAKKDVENKDLWVELLELVGLHKISFYRIKGHLNLAHPSTNSEKWFNKFIEWNGPSFTRSDFSYVVKMNNVADELANKGIDAIR